MSGERGESEWGERETEESEQGERETEERGCFTLPQPVSEPPANVAGG